MPRQEYVVTGSEDQRAKESNVGEDSLARTVLGDVYPKEGCTSCTTS